MSSEIFKLLLRILIYNIDTHSTPSVSLVSAAKSDFWGVFLAGWPNANFIQKNEVMLKLYLSWTKDSDMKLLN